MSISPAIDEPIAVIGYWCRVPGAASPHEFWDNLCAGREALTTLSVEELRAAGIPDATITDPCYVRRRGVLQHACAFDHAFFGIAPAEALITDPQHRQFLECSWLALANAGYVPGPALGHTGVFAAQSGNDYRSACRAVADTPNRRFQTDIYCSPAHLAASIAYQFDLRGPALSVQTACSSSLVAVHLACRALQSGDCEVALAGGVSIGWPQHVGHLYAEGSIMSKDGHCCPFDKEASGTVRGEGVGVVVLKRLRRALSDRDTVRAVIRGSAVTNDGRRRVGYAAPSAAGQAAAIKTALARSGLAPDSLQYVEAHGTATKLGDAIELEGLGEALGGVQPLRIGSVKGNLGHLDAAAGVIGLLKTALMIEHGLTPPSLHFAEFSEELHAPDQFEVTSATTPWKDVPRRAGLSSFGLGGTNAHLVLEQSPARPRAEEVAGAELVILSADSREALNALEADLATALEDAGALSLEDVAHTLGLGRRAMPCRSSFVANSIEDLRGQLQRASSTGSASEDEGPLFFHFPATVAEAAVPALISLYRSESRFRLHFDRCADKLALACGTDARSQMTNGLKGDRTLPTICSGHALAHCLIDLGVRPAWLSGDGLAACTAACVAGLLSLDGLALIVAEQQAEARPETLAERLGAWQDSAADTGSNFSWKCAATSRLLGKSEARDPSFWAGVLAARSSSAAPTPLMVGASPALGIDPERCPDRGLLLALLGRCWALGGEVDWPLMWRERQAYRVPLPHPPLRRIEFTPPAAPTEFGAAPLPRLESSESAQPDRYSGRQETEALVIRCVQEVLGGDSPDATEDFFQIGGCSITALDLQEAIQEACGVEVPLRDIFESASISALAAAVMRVSTTGEARGISFDPAPARPADQISVAGLAPACPDAGIVPGRMPTFSVFFFSGDCFATGADLYALVLEAARFADANGFEAVWTPERHFHRFGGAFPAPAMLATAIAGITTRLHVRAGSVVLPLHDPLRLTEEWAVVDHLSGGRVGISFAPGFHPTDFISHPDSYSSRRETFWTSVNLVRSVWRGEEYHGPDGLGRACSVVVQPRPLQRELPTWITASDRTETFTRAGRMGAGVLTALMAQTVPELQRNIAAYRKAFKESGEDGVGKVTLMLHTFIHPDAGVALDVGGRALRQYLDTHLDFAAARDEYRRAKDMQTGDREDLLDYAVGKYLRGRALIGTPDECARQIASLRDIGVDEVACLVDFGPSHEAVLASLAEVARLKSALAPLGQAAAARPEPACP